MKRAANKTGGGGGVALWQPALIAAAPCFLIFPDHQNNPLCVCVCVLFFFPLCERKLVRFTTNTKHHVVVGVIKSINFRIYLIRRIKHILLALLCFPSVMQIETTDLDF